MSEETATPSPLALSQRIVSAAEAPVPRLEIGSPDGMVVAVRADGSRNIIAGPPPPDPGPPPGWPHPCDCCDPDE